MNSAILILLICIFSSLAFAEEKLKLIEVVVECQESSLCEQRKAKFKNLVGDYRSLLHLKETIRIMAADGGYRALSYDLTGEEENLKLSIKMSLKPQITEINIGSIDRLLEADPSQLVTIKEGEFFEPQKLRDALETLNKKLDGLGYPKNSHKFEVHEVGNEVTINIEIILGQPRIFKSIKTLTSSSFIHEYLTRKFNLSYNKPFELNKFKIILDEASKELFTYGYYLLNLDFVPIVKGNRVILDIKVTNDKLFAFDFKNIQDNERHELLSIVTDLFRKYKRQFPEQTLKAALQEHYLKKSYLESKMRIQTSKFTNRYKETVNLFRIFVDPGEKTLFLGTSFIGNAYYSQKKLHKLFDKEAFELASVGLYDQEYFNYFVGFLKTEYIKDGFVQVKVAGPNISFDENKKKSRVEYIISEGQRSVTRSLTFDGAPPELEDKLSRDLANGEGKPFNPIALVEDIKKVANILQENGYYFAEVTNANDDHLVSYTRTGSEVDIHMILSAGPLVKLNRVILLGNSKTRKKVIMKLVTLDEGKIITPNRTREIESSLSATGLFNSVNVSPMRHNSKNAATDLIVKVIERDYGLVEFAPGFRTDLGIKLTGTVSYTNIGGMNRSITLRSQLNQRVNGQTLDPRRREEGKKLLEYNNSLTYTQGDIFNTLIDYTAGLTIQRRRFYSFDADIQRVNNTITRDFTKTFSTSVRHQFETINQFDATQPRDNGGFQIGAMTPSLTWDLRNNRINATKGAFFNLSCEFANPYFLSQDKDDLTINYYKLISRNRFYIPFKNGAIAISMVGGLQENLAKDILTENGQPVVVDGVTQTQGYIPNIKVFRLTGMDIVRGFNDEEINRLPDGRDITEARIQNKAYLVNFKLEPRYFINDTLMAGVFYDAGRVFVDTVDMSELRDSVGLTFKIITPVGTLDFDYGIKLLRKRNQDGSLEDPGRFHVSIGFF